MIFFRHCNPVTRRCKCDFGYAPITIESDEFKFEHICKVSALTIIDSEYITLGVIFVIWK